jgi:HD-GYP domain-containing protein (c-di-GMP phosphodiesterase class II)
VIAIPDIVSALRLLLEPSAGGSDLQLLFPPSFDDLGRHSLAVARYAKAIAGLLHIPQGVLLPAALHDLGKLLLPGSLVSAPRPLDEEETQMIRRHPALGLQLLSAALGPDLSHHSLLLDAVVHHHEAWNGRGYPLGLAGERIPLIARVVAIADAYDALTHGRPYRSPLSPEEAWAELCRSSGTQFDPGLVPLAVEAFSSLPLSGGFPFAR